MQMSHDTDQTNNSSNGEGVGVDDDILITPEEFNAIVIEYAESLEGWSNPYPPPIVYKTLPDATQVRYELNFWQRLFLVLGSPASSAASWWWDRFMLLVISISVLCLLVATTPNNQYTPDSCRHPACDNDPTYCPNTTICPPIPQEQFRIIEAICTAFLTIDLVARTLLIGMMPPRLALIISKADDERETVAAAAQQRQPNYNPDYSPLKVVMKFLFTWSTLVDLLAVVPSWIYFGMLGSSISQATVPLQALKLFRFFRVIKIGLKFLTTAKLFYNAVVLSIEPLIVLGVIFCLSLFLFGVIFFDLESGIFQVTSDYPNGAFLRTSEDKYTPSPVESVFDSIPTSIYFSGIVIGTVGYGDLFPYSRAGRAFAVIAAIFGVLFFSLPMSIVASHFDREYLIYEKRKKIEEEFLLSIDKDVKSALIALDGTHHTDDSVSGNDRASIVVENLRSQQADPTKSTATETEVLQEALRQSIAISTDQIYKSKTQKRSVRRSVVSTMTRNLLAHKTAANFDAELSAELDDGGDIQLVSATNPLFQKSTLGVIREEGIENESAIPTKGSLIDVPSRRNVSFKDEITLEENKIDYFSVDILSLSRAELEEFVTKLRMSYTEAAGRLRKAESLLKDMH